MVLIINIKSLKITFGSTFGSCIDKRLPLSINHYKYLLRFPSIISICLKCEPKLQFFCLPFQSFSTMICRFYFLPAIYFYYPNFQPHPIHSISQSNNIKMSFKTAPPKPALHGSLPILLSIQLRNFFNICTSRSHIAETVFIELILGARNAFAINFESSLLHKLVHNILSLGTILNKSQSEFQ